MVWNGNDRGKRWSRFNTDTRYAICAFNEFNKHRKRVATTEPTEGKGGGEKGEGSNETLNGRSADGGSLLLSPSVRSRRIY